MKTKKSPKKNNGVESSIEKYIVNPKNNSAYGNLNIGQQSILDYIGFIRFNKKYDETKKTWYLSELPINKLSFEELNKCAVDIDGDIDDDHYVIKFSGKNAEDIYNNFYSKNGPKTKCCAYGFGEVNGDLSFVALQGNSIKVININY